jgi:ABC-type polysaccharide/polyol phosphate transport system ATPase subunit
MSSDVAIDVRGLAKAYRIYPTPSSRLKQMLWRGRRRFFHEFWALHDISFSVARGECVGFLGKNGSGKSTLLQMIAGTLEPTRGTCTVAGRVSALLELGAGFNPDFTGRENVILNGALFGISANEMQERLPSIIEFSELGDFVDQPVKTYSSGMFVRLAFATAIHVEPQVLLVDEALAVGDAAFQYKCMERIQLLRSRGMSILFVTHDTSAVRKICDRAFWLDSGNLVTSGPAIEIADQYDSFMRAKSGAPESETLPASDNGGGSLSSIAEKQRTGAASIRSVSASDHNGAPANLVCMGGELRVTVSYDVHQESSGLIIGVALLRNDQLYIAGLNTKLDNIEAPAGIGSHSITLAIPRVNLLGGDYFCKVGIFDSTGMVKWDFLEHCAAFKVHGPYVAEGVVVPEHEWRVE